MREEKAERARGYRCNVIVVQLLQFTVRKFQSDYRHYIGYPRAIAVRHKQWTRQYTRFGMKAGRGDEMERLATWTTGNNMSNCTIRNTCINTGVHGKPLSFLLRRTKWYDFAATNNVKIEFPPVDPSITLSHIYVYIILNSALENQFLIVLLLFLQRKCGAILKIVSKRALEAPFPQQMNIILFYDLVVL